MLIVKVELHPFGDSDRATTIASMKIINDGTGSMDLGNYDVECMDENDRELIRVRVLKHPRRFHVWRLVSAALRAVREVQRI